MTAEEKRGIDGGEEEIVPQVEVRLGEEFHPFKGMDIGSWVNDRTTDRQLLTDERFRLTGVGEILIELDAVNSLFLDDYRMARMEDGVAVFGPVLPNIKLECSVDIEIPIEDGFQVECHLKLGGIALVSETTIDPVEEELLIFSDWRSSGQDKRTLLLIDPNDLREGRISMSFQRVAIES